MVTIGSPFASSTFSRVSSMLAGNVVLANMSRNQTDLLRIQEQLSSGFLINRPSDDPIGAGRVLSYLGDISRNKVFLKNIQTATGRLNMSDAALSNASDTLIKAQQIFLDQRGGVADAQSRQQAADQVDLLLQDAVRQANTRFEGRALFGGSRTDLDSFRVVNGGVLFNGNEDRLQADVSDGIRMVTNVTGKAWGGLSDEIRGLDLATMLPIDLNPRASLNTKLTDLNNGRGVALGSIRVNGATNATVDLHIAKTVGDVIDLINNAGTGVTASLNIATDTVDFSSGTAFSIQEDANGETAADLGILVSGGPGVFSGNVLKAALTKDTVVGDLFGGAGIDLSGLTITNQVSGQTFTATLGPAVFAAGGTVEQILNAITGSGTHLAARINADGTGIDLVSRLSGGRLKISENGGTTASDLGLLSTLGRAKIADLNNGMGIATVSGPDLQITKKDGTTLLFDVDNAQTVVDLVRTIDNDPTLTASIVGNQIVITDTNAAPGTLTIQNVGGSFAADGLGIKASVTGAGPQTITGTALTFAGVQTDGIFTALIRLRDALAANDTGAMDAASRMLGHANDKILDSRGEVGARTSTLEMTGNRLDLESTELEKLRSNTQDVDLAQAASQFQIQQTVLQASLAAASRILQTTLLDFLK